MPNRPVRQIIQHAHVVKALPEATVREAVKLMAEHRCGSILVCNGERLVGIFTERDLVNRVVAASRGADDTLLKDVMTPEPDTIDADDRVHNAIRRMDECGYRHLPVVEDGKVLGVISIRDLPMADIAAMQPELDERHTLTERMW